MKLAFIWWFNRAAEIYPNWRDGLRAALEELIRRGHTVNMYGGEELPVLQGEDSLLFWGDSNCPFFDHLDRFPQKKGIQLTTWPVNWDNLKKLDIIFCESKPILSTVRANGLHGMLGFGTDTNYFRPNGNVVKDIPYFYPATFSPWKQQELLSGLGASLYCIGTVQPDGQKQWDSLVKSGAHLDKGYFPPQEILRCYQRAQQVIIPAYHGSERTVLEAMSCNILPHVTSDNPRARTYIDEFWGWVSEGKWTRDFVLERYSEKLYADAIEKGFNG